MGVITASFDSRELISVKPTGFCAIARPVCYNKRMLEFYLSGHIYSDESFNFSTQDKIKVIVDGKVAKVLPSETVTIAGANGLKDTKVNVFLPKAIKKDGHTILVESLCGAVQRHIEISQPSSMLEKSTFEKQSFLHTDYRWLRR